MYFAWNISFVFVIKFFLNFQSYLSAICCLNAKRCKVFNLSRLWTFRNGIYHDRNQYWNSTDGVQYHHNSLMNSRNDWNIQNSTFIHMFHGKFSIHLKSWNEFNYWFPKILQAVGIIEFEIDLICCNNFGMLRHTHTHTWRANRLQSERHKKEKNNLNNTISPEFHQMSYSFSVNAQAR